MIDKRIQLQKYVGTQQAIRVTPKHRPDEKYYGVPLAVSEEFLLLHEIREFHLDGYLIVPLKNIRGVRQREAEETMNRILKAEGILDRVGLRDPICLESWTEMFKSLKATGKLASVEAYEPEPGGKWVQDYFLIGKVTGVTNRAVAILPFDAAGEWETEATVLPFRRVLAVTFDNEYANTFAKYLK